MRCEFNAAQLSVGFWRYAWQLAPSERQPRRRQIELARRLGCLLVSYDASSRSCGGALKAAPGTAVCMQETRLVKKKTGRRRIRDALIDDVDEARALQQK